MKINENTILLIGIIGIVVIAVVAIATIKDGALALATGVIGVIGGFLYHPVKNQLTTPPTDPSNLGSISQAITQDPNQTSGNVQGADNITQDSTSADPVVAAATTVAPTINPDDLVNQAINVVQNNPALLQDIISIVGVVSGEQNLLGQVQNVLNNSNADINLITNGIAAVKSLIPNTNTAPSGA